MMWAALLTNQARPAPPLATAEMSPNGGESPSLLCVRPLQVRDVDVELHIAFFPASMTVPALVCEVT
jgi:hypothetical protein